jgi:phosphoribosyl-AMP cyclohydrolase
MLDEVNWNDEGLVPVVAQESRSGRVLMLAWMNRDALATTLREGQAVYWSRARARLWRKGEQSGHVQIVKDIRLDCDNDTILLTVEQIGGIACHTGRHHCFFRHWQDVKWVDVEPVLKISNEM